MLMTELVHIFDEAKDGEWEYVGVKIHMDGFPKDEVIINEKDNIDTKLEYYQKTYDANCNHKFAKGISIVGAAYANSLDDIAMDLNY